MAVVASATGATVFGLSGVAAGIAGGALLGAGAGALYSGLTGDGNILNSALTGGLIGAGVGGLGAAAAGTTAAGGTSALTAASAPSTALAPTANVLTQVPAVSLSSANPAALDALAASQKVFAEGAASLPGAGLTVAPQTITPQLMAATGSGGTSPITAGLTPKEMLGYGLAGTAAMSLLGGMNQSKIQAPSTTTSYIRPYTYNQTRNPYYGQPGQNYYNQGYTAQPVYQAAQGGLMGGPVEQMSNRNTGQDMYPMSMTITDNPTYASSTQMPTSAEVMSENYEPRTNVYSGDPKRMADGGSADSGYIPTSQAVQDYNKLLSSRAVEEYINNPMPTALMPASQRQALMPPPTNTAPPPAPVGQDINGLYQYYLGRQPGKDEIGQWANQINGPVTPEMANYFQQFTGGEL